MARRRNPLRDEAYRIWIESNKQKPLKDIAEDLGVGASTVRKWKSEDKWDKETKRSALNETERYDSMRGNKNAKGNPGGGPPIGNQNAVSHGLFSKYIPPEKRDLMQELSSSDPSDIIWNNILIQYASIIQSQKIMNVRDEFDHTEDIVSAEVNPMFIDRETRKPVQTKITRQFQYAWDKQASFLNAQSRAMGMLANLIKQFMAIASEEDERRKKLDLMTAQIERLKATTPKDEGEDSEPIVIIDPWSDADG